MEISIVFLLFSCAVFFNQSFYLFPFFCMQIIDDYVRDASILSAVEEEWQSAARVAPDVILNLLASAHSMTRDNQKLKSEVQCTVCSKHSIIRPL